MKYKNLIITAVIVIAAVAAFYVVAAYKKDKLPVSAVRDAKNSQPDSTASLDTAKVTIIQGADPCNGTGGTGQIVSVGDNSITIKRQDGINEIIKLTDKTTIRNSAGPVSISNLKTGDRVTVVVMSKHTATVVLVCNEPKPPVKDIGG